MPRYDRSPLHTIESPENVRIAKSSVIKPGVVLRPEGGWILVEENCVINHYCVFHGKGGIHIGSDCLIGPNCGFFAQSHSFAVRTKLIREQNNIGQKIHLFGDNWIGGNVTILGGVALGRGTIVGAGSVVTESFPEYVVVAGNPARIIKERP